MHLDVDVARSRARNLQVVQINAGSDRGANITRCSGFRITGIPKLFVFSSRNGAVNNQDNNN